MLNVTRFFYFPSQLSSYQQGQTLLIVLLIMVVTLTIGLSVATRTVTNIRTATEEDQSQRAFSAAEAGIERVLQDNRTQSGSFSNSATYNASVRAVSGASILVNNGSVVAKDEGVDIWLSTYPNYTSPWSGRLALYWGSSSDVCDRSQTINSMAAVEVVIIHNTAPNYQTSHYVYDPCGARRAANNFSNPSRGGTIGGKDFEYSAQINIPAVQPALLARVIPLYANTTLAVTGSTALPSQGTIVESTGVSGETQRKITVFRGYPKVPTEFFPYLLFSP